MNFSELRRNFPTKLGLNFPKKNSCFEQRLPYVYFSALRQKVFDKSGYSFCTRQIFSRTQAPEIFRYPSFANSLFWRGPYQEFSWCPPPYFTKNLKFFKNKLSVFIMRSCIIECFLMICLPKVFAIPLLPKPKTPKRQFFSTACLPRCCTRFWIYLHRKYFAPQRYWPKVLILVMIFFFRNFKISSSKLTSVLWVIWALQEAQTSPFLHC